jgi:hypothetical protein
MNLSAICVISFTAHNFLRDFISQSVESVKSVARFWGRLGWPQKDLTTDFTSWFWGDGTEESN